VKHPQRRDLREAARGQGVERVHAEESARIRSRVFKDCDALVEGFTTRYAPSAAWLEFLLCVHERESEFTCVHSKLYWQPCLRCHRDKESAACWLERLRPKIIAVLSAIKTGA